jgi:hypothetical protein
VPARAAPWLCSHLDGALRYGLLGPLANASRWPPVATAHARRRRRGWVQTRKRKGHPDLTIEDPIARTHLTSTKSARIPEDITTRRKCGVRRRCLLQGFETDHSKVVQPHNGTHVPDNFLTQGGTHMKSRSPANPDAPAMVAGILQREIESSAAPAMVN